MKSTSYLALEASAGSGKTFALSVRYLSLLFLGANPQKIIALTFTNKSAAEMRERIFHTLKFLESKEELKAIALQTGLSEEEILLRKVDVMRMFLQSDIKISTLDSFFGSVLRRFSLHVGISPEFKVVHTRDEEEVLKRFVKNCKRAGLYRELIDFNLNEEKKLNDIISLLEMLYQKKAEFDISRLRAGVFRSEDSLWKIFETLKSLFSDLGLGARGMKALEASSFKDLLGKSFLAKEDFGYWDFKKYANAQTNALHGLLKEELLKQCEAKEAYFLGTLSKLFSLYDTTLSSIASEQSELSFTDVTNRLHSLLRNEISKDFLYFRLDGVVEHLLIDEFQDTSVVQYQILLPIIEEIRSGIGTKAFKTLFFVGDVKQSIYRFRGGAKALFGYAKKSLQLSHASLDTNFRSHKAVVSFCNEVFAEKITGYECQKVPALKEEGYVSVRMEEDIEPLVMESIERFLARGISPKNIALLVHTNKDASTMKALILGYFPSLHVRLEATLKLIEVLSIRAIISLLKYFYFKENLYRAEFLVLHGDSWNDALRTYECDLAQAPLFIVQKIVSHFELFDNSADMLLFLEVASRYEDIENFLFALETLSDEAKSEDEEGLRVLTVHKSKGLEFEHVIVCDRFTKENNRSDTLLYTYDEVHVDGIYYSMSGRESVDSLYANAKEKEKVLSHEDKLNAQYVAFTRAKSSLCICAKREGSVFANLELSACERGEIRVAAEKEEVALSPLTFYQAKNYGTQEVQSQSDAQREYDIEAITFGIALHYMLEMLDSFTLNALERAYTAMQNRYAPLLSEKSMQEIYERAKMLLTCKDFLALIEGAEVSKEQALMYNNERKQIDLLLIFKEKIVVVDYKSSPKQGLKHHAQVGLYKEALTQMYTLPVEGYICYLLGEKVDLVKSL